MGPRTHNVYQSLIIELYSYLQNGDAFQEDATTIRDGKIMKFDDRFCFPPVVDDVKKNSDDERKKAIRCGNNGNLKGG